MHIKAKIVSPTMSATNRAGDKETVSAYKVGAVRDGKIVVPVEVRCYTGRSKSASTVYASIWAHGKKVSTSGSGTASGYGYHKESAAIAEAIANAGIELYGSPYSGRDVDFKKRCYIDGCGEHAIEEALLAIARALGYRKVQMI